MSVHNEGVPFINGYPALNAEHIDDKDAHSFYTKTEGFRTLESNATTQYYWAKIGNIKLTQQYKYAMARIFFMSGNSGYTTSQRGMLFVRVKQQDAMGLAPIIQLRLKDYANISSDNIKTVTSQNTSSITQVDLYIKVMNAFDQVFFNPLHVVHNEIGASIEWLSDQELIPALPSGTLTDSIEDRTYIRFYRNTLHDLVSGWNKMWFNMRKNDFRSEYDLSQSKFIPKQTGLYTIKVNIRMTTPPQAERSLAVYVNGVINARLGSGFGSLIGGSVTLNLKAYDEVEIYLNTPDAVKVEGSESDSYITIDS
jgi:hypothetical protein